MGEPPARWKARAVANRPRKRYDYCEGAAPLNPVKVRGKARLDFFLESGMHRDPPPQYDLRVSSLQEVTPLFEEFHPYKSVTRVATVTFAVWEGGTPVAAYVWMPPPAGAAKSVCPTAPWGVLALSRMVAVPKDRRRLKHISKPLRRIMRQLLDRSRWPCLVTWSDEGLGHTGFVYQCSGWTPTTRRPSKVYEDSQGRRVSTYRAGRSSTEGLTLHRTSFIQRWEHHAVPEEPDVGAWMQTWGWFREPIPGKTWASGRPAHHIVYKGE